MNAGKVKVFLCGEGPNELGSRFGHLSYQNDDRPGVIHTLLARVQPTGWEVGGAREWKSIRKFRVGKAAHEDTRNVQAAALGAREAGCDVLAFARDRDRDLARQQAIDDGIALVTAPDVIGGVAVPTLEGWILALLGKRRTEDLSSKRAEESLADSGVPRKDGAAMVRVVEEADLEAIPEDAASLRKWLARARDVLPPLIAKRSAGA